MYDRTWGSVDQTTGPDNHAGQKRSLPLPGIALRFLGRPFRSLVIMPTQPPRRNGLQTLHSEMLFFVKALDCSSVKSWAVKLLRILWASQSEIILVLPCTHRGQGHQNVCVRGCGKALVLRQTQTVTGTLPTLGLLTFLVCFFEPAAFFLLFLLLAFYPSVSIPTNALKSRAAGPTRYNALYINVYSCDKYNTISICPITTTRFDVSHVYKTHWTRKIHIFMQVHNNSDKIVRNY